MSTIEFYFDLINFDKFSVNEIFNKTALIHFMNLMQYPNDGKLYYEQMGRFWRGITKDKISAEL